MKAVHLLSVCLMFLVLACTTPPQPTHSEEPEPKAEPVSGDGPQSPRDIDNPAGENKSVFSLAPNYDGMNLCNIHFHVNAEHKAQDFSTLDETGAGGYKCGTPLTPQELQPIEGEICHGVKPGDTIEVHWVYSSCNVEPGKGLGSCLSDACSNPNLRVETQVFIGVNDPTALNFDDFRLAGQVNGYYQAKALPTDTGEPVRYLGSTTGPSFSDVLGSPFQVSWSVRPQCAKLDINSLGKWCEDNVFKEDHGHGVRKLVTNPESLSEIK